MTRRWRPAYDAVLYLGRVKDKEDDSDSDESDWLADRNNTKSASKASLQWTIWSRIINAPGQKYTVGNGQNVEAVSLAECGQYLVIHNRNDVSQFHFQITADENNKFWIKAIDDETDVYVNGKRLTLEMVPSRLKFGDVIYVTAALWKEWNSKWSPKDSCSGDASPFCSPVAYNDFTVLKFLRLKSKTKMHMSSYVDNNASDEGRQVAPLQRSDFLKDKSELIPSGPTWQTDVVLGRVFQCLAKMDRSENLDFLFQCRLVCKTWNKAVSLVIQQHYEVEFKIIADQLLAYPNEIPLQLLEFRRQIDVDRLMLERWKIEIWPGWGYVTQEERDTLERRVVMERFQFDYFSLIDSTKHLVKHLHVNIDYLPLLNRTLVKFQDTLESLTIQVNPLWLTDALPDSECPVNYFPRLKLLQLDFVQFESRYLYKLSNVKWLNGLLRASSKAEQLVLKGFTPVVPTLEYFSNVRKLSISGCIGHCFNQLHLPQCLKTLNTLPPGRLVSFEMELDGCDDQDVGSAESTSRNLEVQENLHQFLKCHASVLEKLELVFYNDQHFLLPRKFLKLKKLWISNSAYPAGENCLWGTKLSSQVTASASNFPPGMPLDSLPYVNWEGMERNGDPQYSLVFGKWDLNAHTFTACIPNVDKIWAWTQQPPM